jgi:hypothetical protein
MESNSGGVREILKSFCTKWLPMFAISVIDQPAITKL